MKRNSILILVMLLGGGLASNARADLTFFGLDNSIQTGNPGDTLEFDAELASDDFVFVNGDTFSFSGPGLLDDSGLFLNFPQLFTPGDDYDGELFTIALPADIPSGTYLGSFSVYGGDTSDANVLLASRNFSITTVNNNISSTPEPGSLVLLGIGLVVVGGSRRRSVRAPRGIIRSVAVRARFPARTAADLDRSGYSIRLRHSGHRSDC
jgi:hypothetical protein